MVHRVRAPAPGRAQGRDEGVEGCLMLGFMELGGGRSEGRKTSPELSFLEGTFIALSCPPTFVPGGVSLWPPVCA